MEFRITGLSPAPFQALYGSSDARLARAGARRYVVDACPGYPDRIELRDALPGETVLLVNHVHQPAPTPYRASHAIFVREGATCRYEAVDEIPTVLATRPVSLRAFDERHWMVDADLVPGGELAALIRRYFEDPRIAYLQAHYAKRGCYAARVDRA